MEYALGTDPVSANSNAITCNQENLADGCHLQMVVPKNSGATNWNYIVETCGALNDWSTANTTEEANAANQLIVRDNFTTASAARRFIRLRVTVQ